MSFPLTSVLGWALLSGPGSHWLCLQDLRLGESIMGQRNVIKELCPEYVSDVHGMAQIMMISEHLVCI